MSAPTIAQRVAKATLRAMQLREESYDKVAAELASKTSEFVDFSAFYGLSIEQAVDQAVAEDANLAQELLSCEAKPA